VGRCRVYKPPGVSKLVAATDRVINHCPMTNIISPTIPLLTPKTALLTYILLASIKCLLIPTYRSTDFDVHRNWLAITHHVPLSEWYFTTNNNTTVHTLDYPPSFAYFEYMLSNNGITNRLLASGWLDQRCLDLLPDITASIQSKECIRFHRGTVICIGDILLFIGAYFFATLSLTIQNGGDTTTNHQATTESSTTAITTSTTSSYLTFFLIVSNPGLILLDHIHFQYNGMLLGLLLLSISCMVRGASVAATGTSSSSSSSSQIWELLSAAIYAILLTMKHLYITLAPLYFFYLLRRHCYVVVVAAANATTAMDNNNGERKNRRKKSEKKYDTTNNNDNKANTTLQFAFGGFVLLATVTLLCFIGPFVPFLLQPNPKEQIQQILKRLFPFNRGLVHDYWAANIWAIYLFGSKVVTAVVRKGVPLLQPFLSNDNSNSAMNWMLEYMIPFPMPQPRLVAIILLISLYPGGIYMAWKVGTLSLTNNNNNNNNVYNPGKFFIHAVVSKCCVIRPPTFWLLYSNHHFHIMFLFHEY
jgi:alpha-1,3-glucosyltransferase